jgi:hypothetical protein
MFPDGGANAISSLANFSLCDAYTRTTIKFWSREVNFPIGVKSTGQKLDFTPPPQKIFDYVPCRE